jgi:arabinan endo-1,5-alpha-L-arabinosidase
MLSLLHRRADFSPQQRADIRAPGFSHVATGLPSPSPARAPRPIASTKMVTIARRRTRTKRIVRTAAPGLISLLFFACALDSVAAAAPPLLRGDISIHDPSTIIKCKDKYYIFGTGQGIISKSSQDKIFWSAGPPVFARAPAWTTNTVPLFDGTFWAPDIMYLNGQYRLYYAVSSWSSQVSAIGLATTPTLDPSDPAYLWTDHGIVIQSVSGSPYNTIDPSVTLDAAGNPWMAFGSYWNGIYIVQLDPLTGLRLSPTSPTYRLAYNTSIEASCVVPHGAYYYLLVNWGSCCSGVNSTYNIRVGRSSTITGPYLDRNGVDMANNGGTLFLEGTGKFTGPGHVGVLSEDGQQWFSYHYYDAGAWASRYGAYGLPDFDLEPLSWTADDWPVFTNDWSAVYDFAADARDRNGQYYGLLLNGASVRPDPNHGHVLTLNGTNQYVWVPAGVAYARTFAAVVKWNGGAPWQRIFDFGTDTSSYVMLTPSSDTGKLRCDLRARGTTLTLQGPSGLPVGVWTHVALIFDGQRALMYVNGSQVANRTNFTLSPLDVRAQTNYLGHSKFAADPDFNGQFASFKVWGRVLSVTELTAPTPLINAPAEGSSYSPGSAIRFNGSARDFMEMPLGATALTWRIQYVLNGQTNTVFGPVSGITNGTFSVPANETRSGAYRVLLQATDSLGRQATTSAMLWPSNATSAAAPWSSFYPFTAGAQDASNLFNGTLNGGASTQADPGRGNVLNLSGASQFVTIPARASTLQTFSGWVNWQGGGPWQRIFDFGQDTSRFLFLTPLDSSGHMQAAITTDRSSFVQVVQVQNALPTNTWTHLAVVFDGREGILYSNGQPIAVNNSVNLLPSDVAATRCYFGRSQFPADPYFNGQLDSIRLNLRPLSLAEILAPAAVITQPLAGTSYSGGDLINFFGAAADFTDSLLPPAAFTWSAQFFHDGQVDPILGPLTGVTNGTLSIPVNGPLSSNVLYRLNLQVTDSYGNQGLASTDLLPLLSPLDLLTVPPGLQLAVDGQPFTTPLSLWTPAGLTHSFDASSPQVLGGRNYSFVLWSDGQPATHDITIPASGGTWTASYVQPNLQLGFSQGDVVLSWPPWALPMDLYTTTNLALPQSWSLVTNLQALSTNFLVFPAAANGGSFFRLQLQSH